jgi:allophanate hydrolase subunit 2
MPIIMGVDCPTTGGYAKIATVIGADLPKLAQTKAGDKIGFIQCSENEAVAALIAERRCYDKALGGAGGRNVIHRSQL